MKSGDLSRPWPRLIRRLRGSPGTRQPWRHGARSSSSTVSPRRPRMRCGHSSNITPTMRRPTITWDCCSFGSTGMRRRSSRYASLCDTVPTLLPRIFISASHSRSATGLMRRLRRGSRCFAWCQTMRSPATSSARPRWLQVERCSSPFPRNKWHKYYCYFMTRCRSRCAHRDELSRA